MVFGGDGADRNLGTYRREGPAGRGLREFPVSHTTCMAYYLRGSVKWSRSAGTQQLRTLRRAVEALPDRTDDLQLAIFAREQIKVVGDEVLGFTPEDLYRQPTQ